ncbi:ATP-binding cassette domain-containing protein [Magnetofaba australis]|uniref:ATP-binding cassette domain-containing protein n=1 Tax=Magnetofaba australis TaxID=1472297 RepID=UPI000A19C6A7|nr:ATP-binding cassette domain-containing protein [Magnetofaba australis]
MGLIDISNLTISFGGPKLLDEVNLTIEPGERVCLIGRNGGGKSTLFKAIGKEIVPDGGEVAWKKGLKLARMVQNVPHGKQGTVFDVVADGLGESGRLLAQYHAALQGDPAQLEALHQQIDHDPQGWSSQQRIDSAIERLKLDPDALFDALSGGQKRRALLARAIVDNPDLLMLDEPTNHLDIPAIEWMEEFLLGYKGTLLFITHDRRFLRRLATRIIELDRGNLTSWPGNFDTYLERKQAALDAEAQADAKFDKKLAQEEAWIRQGIKARRTRNEGRVRALIAMRRERQKRRELAGSAKMLVQEAQKSGKLVVETESASFAYEQTPIVRDLTTAILRGDKVGLLGPNGCGKTTLIKLLLGQLAPQSGEVKLGTKLQIAYFDQHRSQIDADLSVADNVAGGRDRIDFNGETRHIIGYLQDFLFEPERARSPASVLSGGERNRLLLAKLFAQPANMLVLDEPTNDLDAETLELLEEKLGEFNGTVLLVSHDRDFLNNVVTSTLAFEGDGRFREYPGGYDDWLDQRPQSAPEEKPELSTRKNSAPAPAPAKPTRKKLSYKDQRALEMLPEQIEALEEEKAELEEKLADPALHTPDNAGAAQQAAARLEAVESELLEKYDQWERLEEAAS